MPLRQRIPNCGLYSGFRVAADPKVLPIPAVCSTRQPHNFSRMSQSPGPRNQTLRASYLNDRSSCHATEASGCKETRVLFEHLNWLNFRSRPTIAYNKLRLFVHDSGPASLYAKICIYCNGVRNGSLQYLPTAPGSLPTAASLNVCRSGPWERSVQCRKWTKFTHLSDFLHSHRLRCWATGSRD